MEAREAMALEEQERAMRKLGKSVVCVGGVIVNWLMLVAPLGSPVAAIPQESTERGWQLIALRGWASLTPG